MNRNNVTSCLCCCRVGLFCHLTRMGLMLLEEGFYFDNILFSWNLWTKYEIYMSPDIRLTPILLSSTDHVILPFVQLTPLTRSVNAPYCELCGTQLYCLNLQTARSRHTLLLNSSINKQK